MVLLSNEKPRKDFRIIGASLPIEMHYYLTLYCLANKCSKSVVLNRLLEDWIADGDNTVVLVQKINKVVSARWQAIKESKSSMIFSDFLVVMRQELMDKGLDEKYVDAIILEIHE